MQKFVIVSFLSEPPPEFKTSDWPLHVTIVRPFETALDEREIIETLEPLYNHTEPIEVVGKSKELFGGKHRKIPVTELEHAPELKRLHEESMHLLEELERTDYADPHARDFRPHVTDQREGSFEPGERTTLVSVSLVRMDSPMRYVRHTWQLAGADGLH